MSHLEDKIVKAKTKMILNNPFFAAIAVSVEFINTDDMGEGFSKIYQTMATDGSHIYWNPTFVDELSVDEVAGVIAHEVMHIVWLHMIRRGDRHHTIWNMAGDYAINPTVLDAGFTLPRDPKYKGLYEDKYRNWTAEQIYNDLLKNAEQIEVQFSFDGEGDGDDQKDGGGGQGKRKVWGAVIDAKGKDGKPLSEADRRSLEEEIKIKVKSAAEAAKAVGKLPGGLEGLIEAVGKPKINWKDYIQNWVSGKIPDNYDWSRPNRKFMTNYGIYMPRMKLNGAGIGVLSIDTSGSVSDDELRQFVREIVGVIELCNPEKLIIVQHDAILQSVTEWEQGEDFSSLKIKGRGGTNITPVFNKLNEMDEMIDWMILFSDMEIMDWPPASKWPDYPVLLCGTGPDTSPKDAPGTYLPLRDPI